MGIQINKESYEKMIQEDIEALIKYMPKFSLEKRHIIDILNWSSKQIYGNGIAEILVKDGEVISFKRKETPIHDLPNFQHYYLDLDGKCFKTKKPCSSSFVHNSPICKRCKNYGHEIED